jgi:hypothetical protein
MIFTLLKLLTRVLFFIPRFDIARTADGAYNTRYTIVPAFIARAFGYQNIFLHHFQQSDPTEDFHNHPYENSHSRILTGGYSEERYYPGLSLLAGYSITTTQEYREGDRNAIGPDTYHRIDLLDKRGCWTLFFVGKKTGAGWGFLNRRTGSFTPWSGKAPTELYEEGLR